MTKLLVLGMLSERPMSGYDIQQAIRTADAERWGGVLVGSIYHALKKLEQEHLIALVCVEQTGLRQKTIYQITDLGKAHLGATVLSALRATSAQYPTTLYSALSLLDKVPREQARIALAEQQALLTEEYRALEQGQRSNEETGQEVPPLSKITIANMFAILERQRQFVAQIIDVLEDTQG